METGQRRNAVTGSFEKTPCELQQHVSAASDQTAAMGQRQYPGHGSEPVAELDRSLESARSRGYGRYEI